jgi:hypothetical protein
VSLAGVCLAGVPSVPRQANSIVSGRDCKGHPARRAAVRPLSVVGVVEQKRRVAVKGRRVNGAGAGVIRG